jgi:DNA-binding transcriptional MerR regulator
MYSIGQLSQQTGISREAIRYYERIGLLPIPQRAENGYRQYGEADVERLQFIRRSRALDFAINEIREILALRDNQEPPCQYVMDVMQTRLTEIETRIHDLERLHDEIQYLHAAGSQLPEDVQMKTCVCQLIRVGGEATK